MKQHRVIILFMFFSVTILLLIGTLNHPLFHFLVELGTIFIGIMIFLMAVNSNVFSSKNVLLSLGVAYLYICMFDFMSLITYSEIELIRSTSNMSNGYWMGARFLESVSIMTVFFLYNKEIRPSQLVQHAIYIGFFLVSFILLNFSLIDSLFDFYGTSSLSIVFVLSIILFYLMGVVFTKKSKLGKEQKILILVGVLLKVISEIFYFAYVKEMDILFQIGLISKFLSYGIFYVVFIRETVKDPYINIFNMFKQQTQQLQIMAERDPLTNLYNHNFTFSKIDNLIEKYKDSEELIFVAMIDLDNFKDVNDSFGHQKGDEVLIKFSKTLLKSSYDERIVGRYGGDEFIVAGLFESKERCIEKFSIFSDRIARAFEDMKVDVKYSAGIAVCHEGDSTKDLIYKADIKMYESKRQGKNRVNFWE